MEFVIENFDPLTAQPNKIAQLKRLVLDLALRGLLTPQHQNDEPASELLTKVREEKNRRLKQGSAKETVVLSTFQNEEGAYVVPKGWVWCKLGNLSHDIHYGYTASANQEIKNVRLLRITDIQNNQVNWETVPGCLIEEKDIGKYELKRNDILIARTGGTIGKSFLVENIPVRSVFASYLIRVIPVIQINPKFIKLFLESPLYWEQLFQKTSGTGQPNVNATSLKSMHFPLPPLSEQHRIVQRVNHLFQQIDALAGGVEQKEEKRRRLRSVLLRRLEQAPGRSAAGEAWRALEPHFGLAVRTVEDVQALRQTILQLAVKGMLVKQDPGDEPASVLLKRIKAEKERLVKEGKIRKAEALPPVREEEMPFEAPEGWVWGRLGEVGILERGKSKHRPRNDMKLFTHGRIPLVQTGDVSSAKENEGIIKSYHSKYNNLGLSQSRLWPKGTLCITIAANIAECGFLGFKACFPDSIVGFTSVIDQIVSKYVYFFIVNSKQHLNTFAPSTAQKNINLGILYNLLFPLPPLSEQRRIIERVERLLGWCDKLENALKELDEKEEALVRASVGGG